MSGIEALSLVANIFQVIGFASDTIRLCNAIYQGRAPDTQLKENAATLQSLSSDIQSHYQSTRAQGAAEKELERIARKCAIAARALDEEVGFATKHHAQGDLAATLRVAFKTLWRRNRLARLEGSLRQCQDAMEPHLLFRVCKQSDAITLLQEEGFQKLDKSVQYFISRYSEGHTRLSALVESHARLVNEHTTNEARQLEVTLSSHIDKEVSSTEQNISNLVTATVDESTKVISRDITDLRIQSSTDSERRRFFDSLKFAPMNERRNHVTASHEGTFDWIFDMDTSSDSESISSTPSWDDFQEWLLSENDTYWISGKPGSGKSTLVKFLVTSDHTQAILNRWREGAVILSHFFWKPGSDLQKNLKGLLCSLIHQALSHESTVLDKILTGTTSYQDKDHDTDWSVRELGSLCLDTLISYPSPVCIFIDGLDEISNGDLLALLKLINDMRSLPDVKVCVASRPETIFWRRFGNHQQMRLQDLTRRDMWAYAQSILGSGWRNGSGDEDSSGPNFPDYMLSNMVSKAEGVFLWLHLATRSLLRGWENGDDINELESRLEALPGGLSELYADMWSRLNEDSAIYRKVAAEYFHLLLDARTLYQDPATRGPVLSLENWDEGLTLAQFMVLMTRRFREKAIDPSIETSDLFEKDETIETLCQKTEASIQRRCAGLVEVRNRFLSNSFDAYQPAYRVVTFIHRTAYDFLTDSEEGLAILSFYECRKEERYLRLAQGLLASFRFSLLGLGFIFVALRHVRSLDLKTRLFEVLRTARRLWDAEQYSIRYDKWQPKTELHYLSVAATQGFTEFALSTISRADQPGELATKVFAESLMVARLRYNRWSSATPDADFLRSLLRLGADPNMRSAPLDPISETEDLSGWEMTPYGCCVTLAVDMIDSSGVTAKDLLSVVLQTGVAPHGRIVFGIHIGPKGPVLMCGNDVTRQWEQVEPHGDTRKYPSIWKQELTFVIDSSLAFLLEVARFRLSRYQTAADVGIEENVRPGTGTSWSRDICVPFVRMWEPSLFSKVVSTWRIVDGGIRAELSSLFRRWLLPGDDSWMGMDEELIGAGHKVNLDMRDRLEAYERVEGSITHVFGAEECCSVRGCDVDGDLRAEGGGS